MNQMKRIIYFTCSPQFPPFTHQLGNAHGPVRHPQIPAGLAPPQLGAEEWGGLSLFESSGEEQVAGSLGLHWAFYAWQRMPIPKPISGTSDSVECL